MNYSIVFNLLGFLITWKLSYTRNEDDGAFYMSAGRLPPSLQENLQRIEERNEHLEANSKIMKKHMEVAREFEQDALNFLCALIVIKNHILRVEKELMISGTINNKKVQFPYIRNDSATPDQEINRPKRQIGEDFLRDFCAALAKAEMICKIYNEPSLEETFRNFTKSGVQFEWMQEKEDKIPIKFKFTQQDMHYLNILVQTYNETDFSCILIAQQGIAIPQVPADMCT